MSFKKEIIQRIINKLKINEDIDKIEKEWDTWKWILLSEKNLRILFGERLTCLKCGEIESPALSCTCADDYFSMTWETRALDDLLPAFWEYQEIEYFSYYFQLEDIKKKYKCKSITYELPFGDKL